MTLLDPGRYRAEITDQGFVTASTGTVMFFLRLQILSKVDAEGELEPCEPCERTYQKAVKDTTTGWLLADLRAIGVEPERFSQLDPQQPGAIQLIGQEIDAYCEHKPYKDASREEWALRPSRRKLNSDRVRELDAQFGHLLRKNK
jgi:hypothetical protein